MVEIIPAFMPRSFSGLREHIERVRDFVPLVQVDVMDGVFVKGKTWPYTPAGEREFRSITRRETTLPDIDKLDYEIDLMVSEPERVIEDWMRAGAGRIVVHLESTKQMKNIVRDVAAHVTRASDDNIEVVSLGVAINTTTPPDDVDPYADDIDFVQCMGIAKIGKQGEPFDERVLGQLKVLRERHPELVLSVDGAVHVETAPALVRAGATRLVSGSGIFGGADVKKTLDQFRAIVNSV